VKPPVGFGSTIYTDGWPGYDGLKTAGLVHDTVTHIEEYVRGNVHTQGIENFWSLLKRGLNGTYVAVEPYHMDRYLDEQMFRFNNRIGHTDSTRFIKALSQVVNRRLTYAELTVRRQPGSKPKPGPLRGCKRIEYAVKASLLSKPQLRRGRKPRLL
jgi:hypothetical protein